jgi:hypothetical protein
MTPFRRAISLTCAAGLFVGGCALLYWEFSGSGRVPGKIALIPLFMMALAAAWFFSDLPQNLSVVTEAVAGPVEDGVAAYKRGDYATALQVWRPLAEQGDARAQRHIGSMYFEGKGLPQDDVEAVRWWRLAAEQGEAGAQLMLGAAYGEGGGVPQDDVEAVKWFRLAAEQGLSAAQDSLGGAYFSGRGVPPDYAEAAKWYRLAAEQGLAIAQNHLGFMYATGKGVPQDYVEAYMWFTLAASRSTKPEDRKSAAKNVDRAASRMTLAQIAEAQRRAREWKPAGN